MSEPKASPWYSDKNLIALILTPILLFVSRKFGVELNTTEIVAFVSSVITFIAFQKYKGMAMAKAEVARIEAEARIGEIDVAKKAIEAAISNPQAGIKVERFQ